MEILIADDDPVTRLVLTETLKDWGYTVVEAEDGDIAIRIATEYRNIQLMLIDWTMPGKDGLAVCQELKQDPDRFCYIIMLTGKTGTENLVEAMNAGADDFISKPFSPDELHVRLRAGRRIIEQERKISFYAQHDPLTGVWNRRMILHFFTTQWSRSCRENSTLAVLMLDIDHFKQVNDTHGHQAGDEALKFFCATILKTIRPYDYLGRYGGEEFMVLMPVTSAEVAEQIAERIRCTLQSSPLSLANGATLKLTVSIGVTTRHADDASHEDAFKRADEAVYDAKRQGRNRVVRV